MSTSTSHAALHDAQAIRHANREWLSLALLQSRNHTLAWLAALESLGEARWWVGRTGWWQERWIARNVQRGRGDAADATHAALASLEPRADAWWEHPRPAADAGPTPSDLRAYLEATFDTTLELLAAAGEDDAALHWYRAALHEEDAVVLRLAVIAQREGVDVTALLPARVLRSVRAPLWFAAQRWMLGSARGGYVPPAEQWAHEEPVPEFEIDAQPVTWQQFAEFVDDGGYDDPAWWSDDAGRAWLEQSARRSPRDVEQLRHGVLLRRFGRLVRAPAGQAASMLTWHEAAAWCRWAGRRLPSEVEWELAACRGASRGFTWGDVAEWTAGRARAWPGGAVKPEPGARVQRGAAWFEPRRLMHAKARRFVAAADDAGFAGFRSCPA